MKRQTVPFGCLATVCVEGAGIETADQLVEADSSAVTTKSIARITTQPLARYGKPRFTHSKRPVPRVHQIVQPCFNWVSWTCFAENITSTARSKL
jgi:hypothetical protein